MGVVDLGGTATLGREGLLRRGERFDRVALDERDLVPGAAEREGRGETTDPATADQHPLRHLTSRRSSPPGTLRAGDPRAMGTQIAPIVHLQLAPHETRGSNTGWGIG